MIEDGKYERRGKKSIDNHQPPLLRVSIRELEIVKVLKRASRADFPKYSGVGIHYGYLVPTCAIKEYLAFSSTLFRNN